MLLNLVAVFLGKYSASTETDSHISSSVTVRAHPSFLEAFACSSTKSSCLPLGLVRDSFRKIDRTPTETAKCERLEDLSDKSNTDVQSEKPVSTTLTSKTTSEKIIKTVQIRLFSGRQNESSKVLNTTLDDKHETASLESTSILLGDDGLPIGQRAQMRRNAQDITPLYPSGGPLRSTQQAILQKPQTHNIGWRLSQRKILNERRRKISDYCFVLAIVGILLMVLELEFLMAGVYSRLFSVNNCIEDWRIATNCKKMGFVILEILLCMIHPPPIICNTNWSAGQLHFQNLEPEVSPSSMANVSHIWRSGDDIPANKMSKFSTPNISYKSETPSVQYAQLSLSYQNYVSYTTTQLPDSVSNTYFRTETLNVQNKFISLELILAIPMFLRLYLIFRVLLLHSTFFTDAGSRSIGALNRVKINVRFILKRQATARPGTMLLIFILSMWIITSWIMRVCER
ncbi:hypothetical protein PHET_05312 [Paragonimus heterotremus]|uniref:Uncharacterized protein n=1 Tax=Paragonimus heterotremus TaxID=100268 RepID=A0A8J4TL73_9TREM|nr:hypothetical protein PHET_05312 [Paragonimus heterotremus]